MDIYAEPEPYMTPAERRARRIVRAGVGVAVAVGLVAGSVVGLRIGTEALLGQCSPPWLTGTDPQLCLNASVDRRQLIVSGSTSLPDGAQITLWAEDSGTTAYDHWQTDPVTAIVSHGTFSYTFDVSSWGPGTVTANAQFSIGSGQPQEVIDRYGRDGLNLHGPEVESDYTVPAARPPQFVHVSVDVDLSAG